MEIKEMNIYQKMLAIETELATVAKSLEIKAGANSYKAVDEGDILRAVKPLENKYGVFSYPKSRTVVESGTIESVDYKGNTKKQLFERIEVVYRFVNIDKPEEYIETTSYGDGIDSGDKSVGKAMTYADKYALMKSYKIATGDDPDREGSNDLSDANIKKKEDKPEAKKITEAQKKEFVELGVKVENTLRKMGVAKIDDLTEEQAQYVIDNKKAYDKMKAQQEAAQAEQLAYDSEGQK